MTREIKFRGYLESVNRMYSPEDLAWQRMKIDPYTGKLYDCNDNLQGAVILLEYTGLKDKNGTEIYEGDILKHSRDEINVVSWGEWCGEDYYDRLQYGPHLKDLESGYQRSLEYHDSSEVIGNIYQNSKLLEKR